MDEDNLKQLWGTSFKDQRVEIDTDKLTQSLNQKLAYVERKIRIRDKTEISIGLLMIALFGWWLFAVPQILAKLGAGIIVINCVLVIVRLNKAKKVAIKEEPASVIRHNLLVSLQLVKQQIRLSDTIVWWYLLPFFIGVICFFYAIVGSITARTLYTLVIAFVYAYIWYLNKKVVTKKLKPLEGNIVEVLNQLSVSE